MTRQNSQGPMRYRFGSRTLDLATYELVVDGEPAHLEPQTFAVLAHLIRNRHRVVAKEELLDSVWGDQFVGESALTTRIKHLRRALGDDGRTQAVIRTVHRVGYQFVPDVVEVGVGEGTGSPDSADRTGSLHSRGAVPGRSVADDGAPSAAAGGSGLGRAGSPTAASTASWISSRGRQIFGRQKAFEGLAARIVHHRLVTVTGPAGVGKTSLVTRLVDPQGGARAVPDLEERHFCELADTRDPALLANVVLDAVGQGQHSDADPQESLLRALERRPALLVLDNCEHLLDAAAGLSDALLRRCPGVRIVATSRRPLGIADESVLALDPLELADGRACFLARAADAGAQVPPDDPAVDELCRRLDCLPLALELAAARTRLLSPGEILDLLSDRFRLLRSPGGAGDTDPAGGVAGPGARHASLDRAIAWSWEALSSEDQQLLAALTVFAGSFSLDDVAGVVLADGDPLDAADSLERLVSSSLVTTRPGAWGKMQFRLLESVRDFAARKLDDETEVRARHVRYFTRRAERLDAACQSEQLDEALAAFRRGWGDLRAAVGHATAVGDRQAVQRIVRAVGGYADVVQAYEVLDWSEGVGLDVDDGADTGPEGAEEREAEVVIRADALGVRARMLAHRGRQEEARELATRAHRLHESHATLLAVIWCAYYEGDLDAVVEHAPRLVGLSRSGRGLERGFADGFAAIVIGVRQIPDLQDTAVTPADAHRSALGALDCMVAGFRLCVADPERACELLEAVVETSLRNDLRLLLGASASTLTQLTLPSRPPEEAMRTLMRTLRRYLDRGMWVLISADTVMAAKLLADAGDVDTAGRLLGARRASGYRTGLSETLRAFLEAELAGQLGARFEQLAAQGETWRPPEAAEAALTALEQAVMTTG